jgi:hypothetical protein
LRQTPGPFGKFFESIHLKEQAQVPVALEVSRSGVGAHAWVFFTAPVRAELARRLGTGLLREAMALRGRMTLASYDRLFPSQDLLPAGGIGNLIAAPLFRPARDNGATVFLDLETRSARRAPSSPPSMGSWRPGGSRRSRSRVPVASGLQFAGSARVRRNPAYVVSSDRQAV